MLLVLGGAMMLLAVFIDAPAALWIGLGVAALGFIAWQWHARKSLRAVRPDDAQR